MARLTGVAEKYTCGCGKAATARISGDYPTADFQSRKLAFAAGWRLLSRHAHVCSRACMAKLVKNRKRDGKMVVLSKRHASRLVHKWLRMANKLTRQRLDRHDWAQVQAAS